MQQLSTFSVVMRVYASVIQQLNSYANSIPPLFIRVLLAWEFGESGFEKVHGANWFADLAFPFPFNLLPPDISWSIATFVEITGAFAILFGFVTRFFSVALITLTCVAIASVHWPEHWNTLTELLTGYRIIDENGDGFGNYKLPLMYIILFLPLIFGGAGRLSVDYWLSSKLKHSISKA